MEAAGGDITTIIITVIRAAVIGRVIHIPIAVLREQAVIEILLLQFAGPVRLLPVQVYCPIEETDKAVRPPDVW